MRKDCLAGVRDFFELHPTLLSMHVGAVLEKVSDLLVDQDALVRKEFRLLATQLLEGAEPSAIAPHLRTFISHVCGGMSHVLAPIRAAALVLLDDIMPIFPHTAAQFGHKLLPIFLHMLAGGESSAHNTGAGVSAWAAASGGNTRALKLKTMPLGDRLSIVRSLHALLCAVAQFYFPRSHAAAVASLNAAAAAAALAGRGGEEGRAGERGRGSGRKGSEELGQQPVSGKMRTCVEAGVSGVEGTGSAGAYLDKSKHEWNNAANGVNLLLVRRRSTAGGESMLRTRGGGVEGPGGVSVEVEAALSGYLVDMLPLLVQSWAEAYQCATDQSGDGGNGGDVHNKLALSTLREIVKVLEVSLALLCELCLRAPATTAEEGLVQLAAGVCRAVMRNFPLDADALRGTAGLDKEEHTRAVNKGILLLVTMGLRVCQGGRQGGGTQVHQKILHEMKGIERRLCGYIQAELQVAEAAMAGKHQGGEAVGRRQMDRLAATASEGAAGLIEALSGLIRVQDDCRMSGGVGGGADTALLETFTACWLASKSVSACKRAGVRLIGQQLREWWTLSVPVGTEGQVRRIAERWVAALPKLLWTLQHRDAALSKECLDVLADLCRCEAVRAHVRTGAFSMARYGPSRAVAAAATVNTQSSPVANASALLQTKLAHFFRRLTPGGEAEAGPFYGLPRDCQISALALVYYMAPVDEGLLGALAAALILPEVCQEVVARAVEMMVTLVNNRIQTVHSGISFLLTLALSAADSEEEGDSEGAGEGKAGVDEDHTEWVVGERKGLCVVEMVVAQLQGCHVAPVMQRLLRGWIAGQLASAHTHASRQEASAAAAESRSSFGMRDGVPSHLLRAVLLLCCVGSGADGEDRSLEAECSGQAQFDDKLTWACCVLLLRACDGTRESSWGHGVGQDRDAGVVGRALTFRPRLLSGVLSRVTDLCVGGCGEGLESDAHAGLVALDLLVCSTSVRALFLQGGPSLECLYNSVGRLAESDVAVGRWKQGVEKLKTQLAMFQAVVAAAANRMP